MSRMRRPVIGVLLLTVWVSGLHTPTRASCAAPTVLIEGRSITTRLSPGEQVTASGPGWLDECNDTSGSGGGCGDSEVVAKPYRDIQLAVRGPVTKATRRHYRQQGYIGITRRNIVIGHADADEDGTLTFTFEVPDLPPGKYYLDSSPMGYPSIIRIGRSK